MLCSYDLLIEISVILKLLFDVGLFSQIDVFFFDFVH